MSETFESAQARATAAERRARRLKVWLGLTVLLLALLGGAGGLWWWWSERAERAELTRLVNAELDEAAAKIREGKLREAEFALVRAEGHLRKGGPEDLRRRIKEVGEQLAAEQKRVVTPDLEEVAAKLREGKLREAENVLVRAEGRLGKRAPEDLLRRVKEMREQLTAEQKRGVKPDLEIVKQNLGAGKLREAEAALVRAEGRVGDGPSDLVQEVRGLRDQLTMVRRLEGIRLRKATLVDGKFDDASADRDYAALIQERAGGAAVDALSPEMIANVIQSSPIRAQLVAAMDDWALATNNPERRVLLLEVARRADPGKWSDRFRKPAVWQKRDALEQLARETPVAELSPQLLTALATALGRSGGDAVPLLRAAHARHPGDFWLNFELGNALAKARPEEAAGYYRAALALRPDTAAVYNNLGTALHSQSRLEEAIAVYHQAIKLEPKNARAYTNLANSLKDKGEVEEAIKSYRQAIKLDSKYATAYSGLANALTTKGQGDEAIKSYHRAIALDPKDAKAYCGLGAALHAKGQVEEAIKHFRQGIHLDPKYAKAHYGLGNALKAKGQLIVAIAAYRQAIVLDPKDALPPTNSRYSAACAAALAAGGKGKDTDKLGDEERANLRKQALDWLRTDLTAWAGVVDKGPAKDRPLARQALQKWQNDPELAGLRDKDGLEKLPEAERKGWTQFWDDVAGLLKRVPS
jgi:tetratricopeptide (TPR) repeat protein